MADKWSYWAIRVYYDDLPKRSRRKGRDWYIDWADGDVWIGFNEIMDKIGEQGWEIFSVTADDWNTPAGYVRAYRIFAKKPTKDEGQQDDLN